jgi:hypothetical protein
MSIKSKLALVAALTTLVAPPAFAIDQQGSTEAQQARVQATVQSGAYASAERAPRAERFSQPSIEQSNVDFQAVGSH